MVVLQGWGDQKPTGSDEVEVGLGEERLVVEEGKGATIAEAFLDAIGIVDELTVHLVVDEGMTRSTHFLHGLGVQVELLALLLAAAITAETRDDQKP